MTNITKKAANRKAVESANNSREENLLDRLEKQAGKILFRLADSQPEISCSLTRAAHEKPDIIVKTDTDCLLIDLNFFLLEVTNGWIKNKAPDGEPIKILLEFVENVQYLDIIKTFLNLSFNRIKKEHDTVWGWDADCSATAELLTICDLIYEWESVYKELTTQNPAGSQEFIKATSTIYMVIDLIEQLLASSPGDPNNAGRLQSIKRLNSEVISLLRLKNYNP